MDPVLIAYLDERFQGIDERFRGIDESFTQQIQGLREETARRFDKMDEELGHMDEQLRLTDVKVEGLRDDIKQVAEGVVMVNEKLDASKPEVAREFNDTRALIQSGYRDLDKRVKVLERRAGIS
jgi:chromosome segregation ATPase